MSKPQFIPGVIEIRAWFAEYWPEDKIFSEMDAAVLEFLDDGWEFEFEDEFEAYEEQGRGEAEDEVFQSITMDITTHFKINPGRPGWRTFLARVTELVEDENWLNLQ